VFELRLRQTLHHIKHRQDKLRDAGNPRRAHHLGRFSTLQRLALQVNSQNSRTSINPISSALADLKNEPWLLTPGCPASAVSLHGFRVLTPLCLGGGPSCLLLNLVGVSWDGSATASNQKVQIRSLMRLKNMVNIQFCPTTLGSRWCCPLRTALTQGCVVHIQPN